MFTVDFLADGGLRRWKLTPDGAEATVEEGYRPRIHVWSEKDGVLSAHRPDIEAHPDVTAVEETRKRPGWRHDPTRVLAVELGHVEAVDRFAPQLANMGRPGELRLFDVDFSRQFRYCLETGRDPTPTGELSTLSIDVPAAELAADDGPTGAKIDGQSVAGDSIAVLETVLDRVAETDPDVLVLSSAAIVPRLLETAREAGIGPVSLGRRPGYEQLAGQSTYESYGQVGHSPARYTVPGRVIIDRSNTFFYTETNLAGMLDLIERSRKPLEELAWASIGNVLTAIQIRAARERDVLVPWRSWRHEQFKTMGQLRAADRGGATLSPTVGLHEDVHELDFASMYPNIIVTRNISPETIRGECASAETVPELGYEICAEPGYLPAVLEPLIEDRAAIKAERREAEDPQRREELAGRSAALKWILVSCFGYQGFSNAKFGRIEAHEAINAYAREILLTAKEALEAGGWQVLHGIVDSIWVTARPGAEQEPLEAIADRVSEAVDIALEYEGAFDWVAFVPLKDADQGALTKYFGRKRDPPPDGDPYKVRGIALRQRSTPAWVERVQRDLIEALDEHRTAEPVLERLRVHLDELAAGVVDPEALLVRNRVSKPLAEYTQSTRNVAALQRRQARGIEAFPGQDVEYVVVDDTKSSRERVRLRSESPSSYDADFYREQAIRAAAEVLAVLGAREPTIRERLSAFESRAIQSF